uniref:Importin subunit alpha n=1 Tax=Amphimedon queenslandica TaxID=400682 RepID=A0A1X7VS74_AMPQE
MSEGRHKHFKNRGRDQAEMRRRRTDVTIELRKNKKEEQLLKKRHIPLDIQTSVVTDLSSYTLLDITKKARHIDIDQKLEGIQLVRKILSKGRNPPIDELISVGLVPVLVECLRHEHPTLQFEAAWALTNIASGSSEQTATVVFCGDGPKFRDLVIEAGIIPPLLTLIADSTPASLLQNVTWTISNLCRNKNPPPNFDLVSVALPSLAELIQHPVLEVQVDACWALSFLADGNTKQIQAVIDSGVVPKIVPLLGVLENKIVMPALRTLGNIVTGSDEQTQVVLDNGILPHLCNLLQHPRPSIVREAVWTLSNITAGNQVQVQMVIDAHLIPPLIQILMHGNFKTQKEAAWAISNLTVGGSAEQVVYVVQQGCIGPMCIMLGSEDPMVIQVILDGLGNILKMAGHDYRVIADAIEEVGGVERIEALQEHQNQEIYKMAYFIIDRYFNDTNTEDKQLAPQSMDATGYQFSTSSLPGGFKF